MVIYTRHLCKYYGVGTNAVKALDDVNIEVYNKDFIAIMGKSGSGKSTLLNMLGGLDCPTHGDVFVGNECISELDDEKLAKMRRSKIGFIFQNYNLIPVLDVYENITLPLELDKQEVDREYIEDILETLGLGDKKNFFPSSLSGGQQQRVAIARALANKPKIVLADEPTGNLDSETGFQVISMLKNMNKKYGQTMIVVTHDREIADEMDRIIRVVDGRVVE